MNHAGPEKSGEGERGPAPTQWISSPNKQHCRNASPVAASAFSLRKSAKCLGHRMAIAFRPDKMDSRSTRSVSETGSVTRMPREPPRVEWEVQVPHYESRAGTEVEHWRLHEIHDFAPAVGHVVKSQGEQAGDLAAADSEDSLHDEIHLSEGLMRRRPRLFQLLDDVAQGGGIFRAAIGIEIERENPEAGQAAIYNGGKMANSRSLRSVGHKAPWPAILRKTRCLSDFRLDGQNSGVPKNGFQEKKVSERVGDGEPVGSLM